METDSVTRIFFLSLISLGACANTAKESVASTACNHSSLTRKEITIASTESDIDLFVMQIKTPVKKRGAVVLTHGAGSPSSAQWDLLVKDYSMMRFLACLGYDTYAVDIRGFGGSTPISKLKADADSPLVREEDARKDVRAVVALAQQASQVSRVTLLGWSWGALVAGAYAATYPSEVERLILLSPVYDRKWPSRHKTKGAFRKEERSTFFDYHDPSKEDLAVLKSFVEGMFRFTDGAEVLLPNGPYRDLYGPDAPIWDPSKVRADTLIVRGENDRASLAPNAKNLARDLRHAKTVRYQEIKNAGHFFFRTKRYRALRTKLAAFLKAPTH